MRLTSSAFIQGALIPRKYTCQGLDINPPLEIIDVPQGAQSLVLIMDDPDVPKHLRADGMWVHWVVYNIDPKRTAIAEGESSCGVLGQNTSGYNQYMGPCPPDREHRYFFKLYALSGPLSLQEGASKQEVLDAMQEYVIAHCELMGVYEKK